MNHSEWKAVCKLSLLYSTNFHLFLNQMLRCQNILRKTILEKCRKKRISISFQFHSQQCITEQHAVCDKTLTYCPRNRGRNTHVLNQRGGILTSNLISNYCTTATFTTIISVIPYCWDIVYRWEERTN